MGSSISAIYDSYDDYTYCCDKLKIESLDIRNDFYKHFNEIIKKENCKNKYELFKKLDNDKS